MSETIAITTLVITSLIFVLFVILVVISFSKIRKYITLVDSLDLTDTLLTYKDARISNINIGNNTSSLQNFRK